MIHKTIYSCKICFSEYKEPDNLPYIISPCGHTICSKCLKQIYSDFGECPFCKTQILCSPEDAKLNEDLINMIKKSSDYLYCDRCNLNVKFIYYGMSGDSVEILCGSCAKMDPYKYKLFDDIRSQMRNTLEQEKLFTDRERWIEVGRLSIIDLILNHIKQELVKDEEFINRKFIDKIFDEKLDSEFKSFCMRIQSKEIQLREIFEDSISKYQISRKNMIKDILLIESYRHPTIEDLTAGSNDIPYKGFMKGNAAIQTYDSTETTLKTIISDSLSEINTKYKNEIKNNFKDIKRILDRVVNTDANHVPNISDLNLSANSYIPQWEKTKNILNSNQMTYQLQNNKGQNISPPQSFSETIYQGKLFDNSQYPINSNPQSTLPGYYNSNTVNNSYSNEMLNNSYQNYKNSNNYSYYYDDDYNYYNQSNPNEICIVGLSSNHDQSKLKQILIAQVKCKECYLDYHYNGELFVCKLIFDSVEELKKAMNRKHSFRIDKFLVEIAKKPNKKGNRLYVTYKSK